MQNATNTARQLSRRFEEKKANQVKQAELQVAKLQSKAAWELVKKASKTAESDDHRVQVTIQSLRAAERCVDDCQKDLDSNTEDCSTMAGYRGRHVEIQSTTESPQLLGKKSQSGEWDAVKLSIMYELISDK